LSHHHFNSYIIHVLAIEYNIAIAIEKKQLLVPLSCSFIFQYFFYRFKKKKNTRTNFFFPFTFSFFSFVNLVCEKEEAIKEERKYSILI